MPTRILVVDDNPNEINPVLNWLRQEGYDRVTLCEVGRSLPDVASGEEFLRYYKALWNELTH